MITQRKCVVYGSELSRICLLVLARQHNEYNQIQRETTFPETVSSCRQLLYSHFAVDNGQDDRTYMPKIPHYNSNTYKAFKSECMTYLHSPRIVSLHRRALLCSIALT